MVFFDIEIVVYSLIYSVFTNLFIDKMHFQNIMMNLFIISKKEGICELIIRTTGRGVTHWNGFGGYTDEPTNIYLTVVSKREYRLLRRQIKAFDAESFVVINEDINVLGNFEVRT